MITSHWPIFQLEVSRPSLSGSVNVYIENPSIGAERAMPKNKKGEGFHSAAGLIRYFDSEDDKALKVNPWVVVGLCIGVSVFVLVIGVVYPT